VKRLLPTLAALVALIGGWLVAGVVTASPASAHASLVSSTPGDGARVATSPAQVTLQFSEHVTLGPGYARVLGSDGRPVDTGSAGVTGDRLTLPLRGSLPQGSYVVTYRVVSADSHPISGAFSFVVGNAALVAPGSVTTQADTDPVVGTALPLFRWLGYAGLALAVGLPVLALLCWPAGWSTRRLTTLAVSGALAVAVGGAADFLLQGPYAAASGIGTAFDSSLLSSTAATSEGVAFVVRAVLGLVLAGLLLAVRRRGTAPDQWQISVGSVLAAGLIGTTAAVGHAAAGPWSGWAIAATAVHVASMTVWLGGLVGLVVLMLRPDVPVGEVAGALPRFSRLAFVSMAALVITGIVQSVREVSTPGALLTTGYGQLLTAKLVLVVVILGAAGVSRVWVQQHFGVTSRPSRRVTAQAFSATAAELTDDEVEPGAEPGLLTAFRRSVVVELVLAVAVLAVTSVLVGSAPATAAVTAQPFDATLQLRTSSGTAGTVEVSVAPARPGADDLHVFLFDKAGQLTQPAGITVTLTEPAQSIGPLQVKLVPAGPGHYVSDGLSIPGTGTWTVSVNVRVSEFSAATASARFPVR
jgi:copper transport protein